MAQASKHSNFLKEDAGSNDNPGFASNSKKNLVNPTSIQNNLKTIIESCPAGDVMSAAEWHWWGVNLLLSNKKFLRFTEPLNLSNLGEEDDQEVSTPASSVLSESGLSELIDSVNLDSPIGKSPRSDSRHSSPTPTRQKLTVTKKLNISKKNLFKDQDFTSQVGSV